jgi:hypothetical protein
VAQFGSRDGAVEWEILASPENPATLQDDASVQVSLAVVG